jgi:hypothetical protein
MKESQLRQLVREEASKLLKEREWREIPGADMDVLIKAGVGPDRIKRVEGKKGMKREGYDIYADFRNLGLPIRSINELERIGLEFIAIEDATTARLEFRK